jgi:hypothetical protein
MIWARHLKLFTKLGVAALALGALATSGNAQNAYQGKFTLPFETRWGSATLPAGDYTFAMSSAGSQYTLYIRGAQLNAIIMPASADHMAISHQAQLNLVDIADVETVQTFDAPGAGTDVCLSYAHTKAHGTQRSPSKYSFTDPACDESE